MSAVAALARVEVGNTDFRKYTGGREVPWCGYFVLWLFRVVGRPLRGDVVPNLTTVSPLAYPEALHAFASQFVVQKQEPGDVVVAVQKSKWATVHVSVVVEVGDTTSRVVSGNVLNRVVEHTLQHNDRRILCYARFPEVFDGHSSPL